MLNFHLDGTRSSNPLNKISLNNFLTDNHEKSFVF